MAPEGPGDVDSSLFFSAAQDLDRAPKLKFQCRLLKAVNANPSRVGDFLATRASFDEKQIEFTEN
jgi:hypothetical protein